MSKAEKGGGQESVTTILFTKSPELVTKLDPKVYNEDGHAQFVSLYNEKRVSY